MSAFSYLSGTLIFKRELSDSEFNHFASDYSAEFCQNDNFKHEYDFQISAYGPYSLLDDFAEDIQEYVVSGTADGECDGERYTYTWSSNGWDSVNRAIDNEDDALNHFDSLTKRLDPKNKELFIKSVTEIFGDFLEQKGITSVQADDLRVVSTQIETLLNENNLLTKGAV